MGKEAGDLRAGLQEVERSRLEARRELQELRRQVPPHAAPSPGTCCLPLGQEHPLSGVKGPPYVKPGAETIILQALSITNTLGQVGLWVLSLGPRSYLCPLSHR